MKFRYISWKLTNTWKHFGLILLLGIAAWFFAYVGKAHGLGWFPNIAASLTLAAEGTTECVKCVVVGNVRYNNPAFDFGGGSGNQIAYNSE